MTSYRYLASLVKKKASGRTPEIRYGIGQLVIAENAGKTDTVTNAPAGRSCSSAMVRRTPGCTQTDLAGRLATFQ